METSHLLKLPDEILHNIFGLLESEDLSRVVLSFPVPRLRQIIRKQRFRSICITFGNLTGSLDLLSDPVLRYYIQEINVRSWKGAEAPPTNILRRATSVRCFKWTVNVIPDDLLLWLAECPLEILEISTAGDFKVPSQNCWKLRSLKIIQVEDSFGLAPVLSLVSQHTKTLEVLSIPVSDNFEKAMSDMPLLRAFEALTSCHIQTLCKLIIRLPQTMRHLDLYFIGATVPAPFIKAIARLSNLKSVHLSGNNFTVDHWLVSSEFSNLRDLSHLTFHWKTQRKDAIEVLEQRARDELRTYTRKHTYRVSLNSLDMRFRGDVDFHKTKSGHTK